MVIRNKLSNYLPNIITICLEKRYEIWHKLDKEISKLGGNMQKFVVGPEGNYTDTDQPPEWQGTRQSWNYYHCLWSIIELAKSSSWDKFLLLEDDAWIQPQFESVFYEVMDWIKMKELDYDMLYLGANHHESAIYKIPNSKIVRSTRALDMHAVIICESMYDQILSLRNKDWLYANPYADITIAHAFHSSNDVYAIHPSIVYQRPGFSFNQNENQDRVSTWQKSGILL